MAPLMNGMPDMVAQLDLAAEADQLGFAALWVRDVPLFDLAFNDAGQIYDPWVRLGQLATTTKRAAARPVSFCRCAIRSTLPKRRHLWML